MTPMEAPTVYCSVDFDFDNYSSYETVMAFNKRDNCWVSVHLADVEDEITNYPNFFFTDDLPATEPDSPTEKVKNKVDEMISWVQKWSVRAPAVDDQLQEFRTEIFGLLDEMTV